MKKIAKNITLFVLSLLLLSNCVTAYGATGKGWFTKGNNTYYRMKSGKLVKNQEKTIGKYRYLFDKKGRVVKGTRKNGIYTDFYNKKSGRYQYTYVDLKITAVDQDYVMAKNGEKLFFIENKAKVVTKKGKRVSFAKLKKAAKIRVYFNGILTDVRIFPPKGSQMPEIDLTKFDEIQEVKIR